ncbi:VENN motif pre-toxin domain-containing protein [Providencia vermicola]|uniref:VENN motif pre-toxin domain-containing protein n=1 Tax=Providencia vermicola TaxID=333965 RepID=UPI003D2B4A2B
MKEQTGIFAGKGGFDVNVKEHTQLDGAVMASTADKDKNRLDTGTLGWKDIDNKADFTSEHTGGSIGTGGPIGSQLITNAAGGLLSNANNSGHAEGTTQSAVSDGTVIVRNEDKQKQDVNELNRDTEHANDGSINPIFDKEKEQNRLKQSQLIGEIGNQTMDIIRTEGDIAGLKAQKDPDALAIAKKQLESEGKTLTDDAIKQQAYNNAMAQYGTGSDFQKAAQAVTGLLQGLAGDNLAGALANASSPYLATLIKQQVGEDNKAANAMAHAVLGAVVAELNNQSAAAGGLGAGGGELSAHVIMDTLFPGKKVSDLTESEKQQVSALSQLASGLAGGLTTGDVAGAITGSQAAKNAVENNALSSDKLGKSDCLTMSPAACGKAKELNQRILDKGLPSVETMRDKLASCQDDACRKAAWTDYRAASDATISTLKEMALSGELSREELAFINHELGKELAVRGYREGGKIGVSENLSWINKGQGPLTGFFDTELRQQELVNSGMTVADAAQFVQEEQRNLMLMESAVGAIGSKGGSKVNIIGKGSKLPTGYSPKDNAIVGPKGSTYSNTGKTDASGNTVYSNNGGYYTFENGVKTKVSSPNPPTNVLQNSEKGKEFEQKHYEKYQQENITSQREITIKTESGTKVRVDMIGKDKNGVINCVECKSSQTAPLTDNQKIGYPDLEKNGGIIVGEGKPGFEGGTKLPPTKVEIVRPEKEK